MNATQPGQLQGPALRNLMWKQFFHRLGGGLKIKGNIVCVPAEVSENMLVICSDQSNVISLSIFQIITVFPENHIIAQDNA